MGGPSNTDHSILGSIKGFPLFSETTIFKALIFKALRFRLAECDFEGSTRLASLAKMRDSAGT